MTKLDERFYRGVNARAAKLDPVRCRPKRTGFIRTNWALVLTSGIILTSLAISFYDAIKRK